MSCAGLRGSIGPIASLLAASVAQLMHLSITMGYHRLWSHHAFTAKLPLRIILVRRPSLSAS